MYPPISGWELASLIAKLLIYPGFLFPLGGGLCLWLYGDGSRRFAVPVLWYCAIGALLGFNGSLLFLLLQVGTVNDQGLPGMLDWPMLSLMLDTPAGDAALLRLSGTLATFLIAAAGLARINAATSPPGGGFYRRLFLLNCIAALLVIGGFRLSGHAAPLPALSQFAIVLHVAAVAAWLGCFVPLYILCRSAPPPLLHECLRAFGDHARYTLLLLIAPGIYLLTRLLTSPADLLTTPYGNTLLSKLLLVAALLFIAAHNRYRLVPRLLKSGPTPLRRAITLETLTALLLLTITALLATLITPPTATAF